MLSQMYMYFYLYKTKPTIRNHKVYNTYYLTLYENDEDRSVGTNELSWLGAGRKQFTVKHIDKVWSSEIFDPRQQWNYGNSGPTVIKRYMT